LLAEGRKPNIIQTLMEKLSESSYLLREAINKQVFIETIMLKSMRAAHSIPIESLITRLNQIRRTGELAGIEKVPSLASIPVDQPSHPVPPPLSVPAEKKTADEIEKSVPSPADNQSPEEEKNEKHKEAVKESLPPPVAPIPAGEINSIPQSTPVEKAEIPEEPEKLEEKINISVPEKVAEETGKESNTVQQEVPELPSEPVQENPGQPKEEENKLFFSGRENDHPQKIWEALSGIARKEKKISLAELILLGVPQRIENNELVVAFDQEYGETALTAVCAEIYFLMEKLAEISPLAEFRFIRLAGISSFTGAVREKALDDLKREVAPNETVKACMDLFGGKILDVLENISKEQTY
ncbi:MAG: hypothetical protein IKA79_04720, partial [Lentisphaeria bacterium]|nr:hypothetical protein [Lentisphaeria bacterium]